MKRAFPLILFFCLLFSSTTYLAQAQNGEGFWEDFQSGAGAWELEPNWLIAEDQGLVVLQGESVGWARLPQAFPNEFILRTRVRILTGSLHLITHLNEAGRYFISLNSESITLHKQYWPDDFQHDLAAGPSPIIEGSWVDIDIVSSGEALHLFANGEEIWSYLDPEKFQGGAVAFETLEGSLVQVDTLAVEIPEDSGGELPAPGDEGEKEPAELLGEPPPWIRTGGPLGGLGYDVRMHPDDPDKMYVTDAYAGVFISDDGGQTWYPSNQGITDKTGESQDAIPVFCLTIDPHDPDVIWVGTQFMGGLFKSSDGGKTWTRKTNGITIQDGLTFRGITIDPVDPQTIYAAGEISSWSWSGQERMGREFDLTQGIVYKSNNGGESWNQIWRGDNLARYIWVNPEDNQTLYVSTGIFDREAANSDPISGKPGGVGVLKSTDGGLTWRQANNGLKNLYVGTLFMHPEDPEILLAGTGNNQYFMDMGIYLSTDGAESWTQVYSDININSVEISLTDPRIAYAGGDPGLLLSEDGGQTWSFITEGENGWGSPGVRAGFPIDFQVDPRDSQRIFANNYGGGNFLSEDGGQTWGVASTGYTGAQVRSLDVHPAQSGLVYAAARSGIFRSLDGGSTWTGIGDRDFYALEWNAVAVNPANTNSILAATNYWSVLGHSSNAGASWQPVLELGPNRGIRDLVFSAADPNQVFAATGGFISAGVFDPGTPGKGVYRSLDGGMTWEQATKGQFADAHITEIAVARHDSQIVYAATSNHGVIRSLDGGESWEGANQGLNTNLEVRSVALHPDDPQVVFAGLSFGGLYRSLNGGESWQILSAGLNPEALITSITIDPTQPEVIYITDMFTGVHRSLDGGESWRAFNDGLEMRAVFQLAISKNGETLYAATEGGGVYRRDLTGSPPAAAAIDLPAPGETEGEEPGEEMIVAEEEEDAPMEVDPPGEEPKEEETGQGSQFCPTSYLPLLAGIAIYLKHPRSARRRS